MSTTILMLAAIVYAATAAAFALPFLRHRTGATARVGEVLLAAGFAVHAVAIGVGCAEFAGRELFSLAGGLVLVAWLGAGACLFMQRVTRMPEVGAFVMPLILVVLSPALFGGLARPALPDEVLRSSALQLHIVTATLGFALFGIASGISVMYLLQGRQLKRKQFGRLFSRLPALESLARLNIHVLRAGFLSYCVAFVIGLHVAHALWKTPWSWDAQQVASALVLAVYGAVALAFGHGWRPGRRAAATIAAFAVAFVTMVGLRVIPGATRHSGEYGVTPTAEP